jgi:hypothetical protein
VDAAQGLVSLKVHKQIVNRLIEPWMWITVLISATEWTNFFGLRCHKDAEPHFQHIARMMQDARDASTPRELKAGEWHLPLIYDEDWHHAMDLLGFGGEGDPNPEDKALVEYLLIKVSVGRCARVSYLTHDGRRDLKEDNTLHDRMVVAEPLHASPAEHVAQALDWPKWWTDRPTASTCSIDEVQRDVLQWRLKKGDVYAPGPVRDLELVLSQLRSGNYIGWRQYRKTLLNEHIGGPMP